MDKNHLASIILRLGVAFAFIYAAVAGFVDSESWIGWFPKSVQDMLPAETLLLIWGIVEIILGLWILSGKKIFVPSLVASLSLAGLILTNLGAMDIIFRDVTILAATVALAIEHLPSKSQV